MSYCKIQNYCKLWAYIRFKNLFEVDCWGGLVLVEGSILFKAVFHFKVGWV